MATDAEMLIDRFAERIQVTPAMMHHNHDISGKTVSSDDGIYYDCNSNSSGVKGMTPNIAQSMGDT